MSMHMHMSMSMLYMCTDMYMSRESTRDLPEMRYTFADTQMTHRKDE